MFFMMEVDDGNLFEILDLWGLKCMFFFVSELENKKKKIIIEYFRVIRIFVSSDIFGILSDILGYRKYAIALVCY